MDKLSDINLEVEIDGEAVRNTALERLTERVRKSFEDRIGKISDEYASLGAEKSCLDGDFTSKELRLIADVMDEYKDSVSRGG